MSDVITGNEGGTFFSSLLSSALNIGGDILKIKEQQKTEQIKNQVLPQVESQKTKQILYWGIGIIAGLFILKKII